MRVDNGGVVRLLWPRCGRVAGALQRAPARNAKRSAFSRLPRTARASRAPNKSAASVLRARHNLSRPVVQPIDPTRKVQARGGDICAPGESESAPLRRALFSAARAPPRARHGHRVRRDHRAECTCWARTRRPAAPGTAAPVWGQRERGLQSVWRRAKRCCSVPRCAVWRVRFEPGVHESSAL